MLLPTSGPDVLTDYYMIPTETLPLLAPLQLLPFIGNPLVDLLQPALRVLVNLGYGNIENGWSPGFADVPTGLGFLPDASVLQQVPQAFANGVQQGITDFFARLADPDNYVYSLPAWAQQLLNEAQFLAGSEFSVLSMVPTTWQDLFETFLRTPAFRRWTCSAQCCSPCPSTTTRSSPPNSPTATCSTRSAFRWPPTWGCCR